MQYYTFELNKQSQMFCAIITPFGKYKYKHILTGLNCIPDFAQQIMEQVLCGLENVFVHLDDINIFSKTWEEHLLTVEKFYHILK